MYSCNCSCTVYVQELLEVTRGFRFSGTDITDGCVLLGPNIFLEGGGEEEQCAVCHHEWWRWERVWCPLYWCYRCLQVTNTMSGGGQKRAWGLWYWNYRWLWVTMRVMRMESGSSWIIFLSHFLLLMSMLFWHMKVSCCYFCGELKPFLVFCVAFIYFIFISCKLCIESGGCYAFSSPRFSKWLAIPAHSLFLLS